MVNMSHDRNNRRSLFILCIFYQIICFCIIQLIQWIHGSDFYFKLFRKNFNLIFGEKVIFGHHHTKCKKYFNHFTYRTVYLFSEFIYPYIFRDLYRGNDFCTLFFDIFLSFPATFQRTFLLRTERLSSFYRSTICSFSFLCFFFTFLLLSHHLFIDILVRKIQEYNFFFSET